MVADPDDAVAALAELGGPIALKLSSPAVQHKSELGGVALGLADPLAVRDAFTRIAAVVTARRTRALRRSVEFLNLAIGLLRYFFLPSLRKMYSPAYFTPLPL